MLSHFDTIFQTYACLLFDIYLYNLYTVYITEISLQYQTIFGILIFYHFATFVSKWIKAVKSSDIIFCVLTLRY